MNRRNFLESTLLGSTALSIAQDGDAAPIPSPSATVGFSLGVATYSLRMFQRTSAIRLIKSLGVNTVDIKEFHLRYIDPPEALAAGRKEFDRAGLAVVGGGNIDMQRDEELRPRFEYARNCGFPIMIIAPSARTLPQIERLVKEFDIKVAIHNHGPEDKNFPTPQSVLNAVKDMDPRVGLCVDLGHTARAGADPVQSLADAGARLYEIHIKDLTQLTYNQYCPVGDGKMPVPAIFRQLQKMGYKGSVSLEYEIDEFDPFPGMQKSFAYMRGVIAGMEG